MGSTTVIRHSDGSRTIIRRATPTSSVINRTTKDRGGRVVPEKSVSTTTLAVKTEISGGRTQTVNKSGKVTIRDNRGKVVERFNAEARNVSNFIRNADKNIRQQVLQPKSISIAIAKDPRVQALVKAGITTARQVFNLSRRGQLDVRGRTLLLTVGQQVTKAQPIAKKYGGHDIKAVTKKKGLAGIKEKAENFLLQLETRQALGFQSRKEERAYLPLSAEIKKLRKLEQEIKAKGGAFKSGEDAKRIIKQRLKVLRARAEFQPEILSKQMYAGLIAIGLFGGRLIVNPGKTIVSQVKALTIKLPETIKETFELALVEPGNVLTQFAITHKVLGFAGKTFRALRIGSAIAREGFIALNVPPVLKKPVRIFLKAGERQAGIKPFEIKNIKAVDFFEVKSLTRPEAKAVSIAIKKTDSVVFGSVASRTLSKKRTLPPKDVDIGTLNINTFNKAFIESLPSKLRRNYKVRGQKLIRISDGRALYDIKPLNRIIPQRSILTGRGTLPITGVSKKLQVTRFTKANVNILKVEIRKAVVKLKQSRARLKPADASLKKVINRNILQANSLLRLATKKGLKSPKVVKALKDRGTIPRLTKPFLKKGLKTAFEVKTRKLVKVKGIKLTSFGEQTLRKGLGTLQVLIERNSRRAKDPQAFLLGLEIQRGALRKLKPLTPVGRLRNNARINSLSKAITLLRSKEFSKLLESKVPGITQKFPLVKKLNPKRLRRVNTRTINNEVRQSNKRIGKIVNQKETLRKIKPRTKAQRIKLNKRINVLEKELKIFTSESRLPPSRLPKSFLPSKIPKSLLPKSRPPSKIPKSKIPVKKPSMIPSGSVFKDSRVPPGISKSMIPLRPPSRVPPSRPPSRVPPGRPPSRIPPSKVPPSKPPRIRPPGRPPKKPPPERPEKKKELLKKIVTKSVNEQKLIFIPDLYSVVYGITASMSEKRAFLKVARLFTGFERRKLIRKSRKRR